jgi:hypothetical protein
MPYSAFGINLNHDQRLLPCTAFTSNFCAFFAEFQHTHIYNHAMGFLSLLLALMSRRRGFVAPTHIDSSSAPNTYSCESEDCESEDYESEDCESEDCESEDCESEHPSNKGNAGKSSSVMYGYLQVIVSVSVRLMAVFRTIFCTVLFDHVGVSGARVAWRSVLVRHL